MLKYISEILTREGISLFAPVPLSACRILRPYLLERTGIADGSAVILAVPYASPPSPAQNVSSYAVARDYHLYFQLLFGRLLPLLRERFPQHRFAAFSDHSPIDEVHAACIAGLGVMGDNGLLLTEPYSSYVFLGELITDADLPAATVEPRKCHHCGACRRACPVSLDKSRCISALTQKKGELTEEETKILSQHNTVWGCDICQQACPFTAAAQRHGTLYDTPAFFREQWIPVLTEDTLDGMDEASFRERAYSWRGRAVIRRNLTLHTKKDGR